MKQIIYFLKVFVIPNINPNLRIIFLYFTFIFIDFFLIHSSFYTLIISRFFIRREQVYTKTNPYSLGGRNTNIIN